MGEKIFLNPGHAPNGIPDPGCINRELNVTEVEIAVNVANMVSNMLTGAGYETMVYQNDSLNNIAVTANNWGADYFISIHVNDYPDDKVNGTETYCFDTLSEGGLLADAVHYKIVTKLNMKNRGVKEAGFTVIKRTAMPAILVELGFINSVDIRKLMNRQEDFAKAIYDGIIAFLEDE